MKQILLKLKPEQHQLLKDKAYISGLSMSALVRHWINNATVEPHPIYLLEQKAKANREELK